MQISGELLDQAYESTEQLVAPILAIERRAVLINSVSCNH